ncbi:MAG: DUF6449 domain-containing protein [Oscillospiraceae bacterium]
MTTATSFFDKKFINSYKSTIRRTSSLGIFYTVCMIAMVPLMYLLQVLSIDQQLLAEGYRYYFMGYGSAYTGISAVALIMLASIVPIVVGVNIFSYMHNRSATDVFHGLPVSRGKLFSANYLAGVTIINIPIIISFLMIIAIGACNSGIYVDSMGIGGFAPMKMLAEMLCWIVMTTSIFTITSFVAVICGTGFDTAVLSLAACGVMPVILLVTRALAETMLLGFNDNYTWGVLALEKMVYFSPFTTMIPHFEDNWGSDVVNSSYTMWGGVGTTFTAIAVWFVISVVLFFAAMMIYKKRKSEIAGRTTASSLLNKVIQYIVVYVVGSLFGLALWGMFDSKPLYLLGVIIGGGLAFVTFEAVTARGFKSFPKAFKHMGISVGITLLLGLAIMTGFFGYQNRIPQTSELQAVTINYNGRYQGKTFIRGEDYNLGKNDYQRREDMNYELLDTTLTDEASIEIVRSFHKAIIDEKSSIFAKKVPWDNSLQYNPIITYTLKNGKTISRSYNCPSKATGDYLLQLENMQDFKEETCPAYLMKSENLSEIIVRDRLGSSEKSFKFSKNDYEKLLVAMRKDVSAETAIDIAKPTAKQMGYVELVLENYNGEKPIIVSADRNMLITEKHNNTLSEMNRLGMEEVMTEPKYEFEAAAVCPQSEYGYQIMNSASGIAFSEKDGYSYGEDEIFSKSDAQKDKYNGEWRIVDKEDIQTLYDNAYNQIDSEDHQGFAVCFKLKGDKKATIPLYVPYSKVPELAKKYTNQPETEKDKSIVIVDGDNSNVAVTENKTVTIVTTN